MGGQGFAAFFIVIFVMAPAPPFAVTPPMLLAPPLPPLPTITFTFFFTGLLTVG